MDFHAAMETFAEAWVAANVHTTVNTDPGQVKIICNHLFRFEIWLFFSCQDLLSRTSTHDFVFSCHISWL